MKQPEEIPLVQGGQGRSADDLFSDAMCLVKIVLTAAIIIGACVIAGFIK